MSEFIELQQEIIDQELATMPAKEANEFLGRLGQIRAAQIYRSLDGF